MTVLRPKSVSTGYTDRQLDFSPQSPQPSQTRLIDHDPFGRLSREPALALAAEFGRALLVVNENGDALDLAEYFLGLDRPGPGARPRRSARGRGSPVILRLRGGDDDAPHSFGGQYLGQRRDAIAPVACWPPVMATAELYSSL